MDGPEIFGRIARVPCLAIDDGRTTSVLTGCHLLAGSGTRTSLTSRPSKAHTEPAVPGGIGAIRPATAGGQLVRDAPATNAATMYVACRSNDWRARS